MLNADHSSRQPQARQSLSGSGCDDFLARDDIRAAIRYPTNVIDVQMPILFQQVHLNAVRSHVRSSRSMMDDCNLWEQASSCQPGAARGLTRALCREVTDALRALIRAYESADAAPPTSSAANRR